MKLKSENAVQRKIVCLSKRLTLRIEGDTPTQRLPMQFRFLTPHSPRGFGDCLTLGIPPTGVGGLFRPSLQQATLSDRRIPPTAVGGLFRSCLGELRLAGRQDATTRAYSTTP